MDLRDERLDRIHALLDEASKLADELESDESIDDPGCRMLRRMTDDALAFAENMGAAQMWPEPVTEPNGIREVVPGHVYHVRQLGDPRPVEVRFIRRSGGAVRYDSEWPGLQTQALIRVCIMRTQYLHDVLPCVESLDAVQFLRESLFRYEARAHRRKQEEVNRKQPAHDDTERPRAWRDSPFNDVPFGPDGIELLPIDAAGHVIIKEK